MSYQQIYSLNGGEISRRLWSRPDMARYFSSVAALRNFLPLPYGGIQRRPGFEHIAEFDTDGARLLPFRFSSSTTFILAFGDEALRFYSNGAEVEDPASPGNPLEVVTPYTDAQLSGIRWEQVQDAVYLVHPSHPPYRLFRLADDDWTLAEWSLTYPPFRDRNTDTGSTISASGTTGSVTLTASSDLFTSGHVGASFRIGHVRDVNAQSVALTGTGSSSSMLVSGAYTVRTTGTWTGTVALEGSTDNSTWETLHSWTGAADLNVEYIDSIDAPLYLRVTVAAYTSHTGSPRLILEADEPLVWGTAEVTAYSSATSVTATVTETLQSTSATHYWQEGSWSDERGWPETIALHDGRMTLGGNASEPLTMWASRVDDFPNFRQVAGYPDYALQRTLYSATADTIRWMTSRAGALIVGTAGDEWLIPNASDPDAASAQRATAYGSAAVGVVELNDSLLFVQRLGRKVRDWIGLDGNDGLARDPYAAAELTLVAEHITRPGVAEIAVSQQPDAVLWCVTDDGDLAGLTYERNLELVAWHVHETDGTIESVATIPGTYGDEVWIAVLRDGTRRIERMHPPTLEKALDGATDETLYADAGKLVDLGSPGTTVTGLDHLEGLEVAVCLDGGEHPNKTVASGQITLDRAGTMVAVGLPFESLVETLPLVAGGEGGSTRYQTGRIDRIIVDLHETFGAEYSDATLTSPTWYALQSRIASNTPNEPPPLATGPVRVPLAGAYDAQPRFQVRQTVPLPCTILALAVSWQSTQTH